MGLRERLQRLDDNAVSNGIVWGSDHFGWWWNLGLGVLLLIYGVVLLIVGRAQDRAVMYLIVGGVGVLVGLVLLAGRRRRKREGQRE